ncbi:3-oxoacyl-[acyl-carrier-protein] synthase II [Tsukamurella ocularis]|nr:3-oxoacyl-[acyl-carrier-protein] synthase II [Tsukamurella ocularis]MCS3789941.1 3-oxoacyl-[acyl-carrier-protein] synthase II [Tsukamurella ocularis]MCS3852438.1 3-oxoacyl-[acyl-carrier-protein] synthase II [Tsukamurella ocularis]
MALPVLRSNRGGRASTLAAYAAEIAINDARLDDAPQRRVAVAVGTTNGESASIEDWARREGQDSRSKQDCHMQPSGSGLEPHSLTASVIDHLRLQSVESQTFATACAAGNYAIMYGAELIAHGDAQVAVVGGADAYNRWGHVGFARLGAVAASECRPFDAHRDGMLPSEGAAFLVLESEQSARKRSARVYAELRGSALTCDAKHPTAPDQAGVVRCAELALERARLDPSELDYISAHGTGTHANDLTEAGAMALVLAASGRATPISSVKSSLGHMMGAASAIGAAASCLSISGQFVPPTVHLRHVDPELEHASLDFPRKARPGRVKAAMNNGFAFGGNNAITVFGEYS